MKKSFRKIVAWACAITMVVSSVAMYDLNTAKADIYSETTTGWTSWLNSGQTITADGNVGYTISGANIGDTWWHVQTWLPDVNFTKGYTYACSFTLTSSTPKTFRLDENASGDPIIFTETSTEGWVDNGDGTYTYNYTGTTDEMTSTTQKDVRISYGYFSDGTEQEGVTAGSTVDMTLSNFTITREATGETEADPTTAGADESGYTQLSDNTDTIVGEWTLYAGTWGGGVMSYKGSTDDLALKVISSNNNPGGWGLQAKRSASVYSGLTEGTTYTMTLKYTSTAAGQMFVKQEGIDDGHTYTTVAGENTVTADFTYAAGLGAIVLELSGIPAEAEISNISFAFAEVVEEESTEEVTSAEEETSTEEVTSSEEEVTSAEEETSSESGSGIDWSAIDWAGDGAGGGAYANLYKFYCEDGTGSLVNIQAPGFASEPGLYVTFPAGISDCTVSSDIQGAGIILHLSAFTAKETKFTVTDATGTHTCYVYYENGTTGGEEETTTVAGGEEETTTPEETTTAKPAESYEEVDWDSIAWVGNGSGNTDYTEAFKFYSPVTNVSMVNIQESFGTEAGFYFTNTNAPVKTMTINGVEKTLDTDYAIQGAGTLLYPTALEGVANTIVITTEGNATYTFFIYAPNYTEATGPVVDEGVQISGWQIATGSISVGGNTYDGGVRTVYTIADTVAGQSTEGATVGLVYGLAGEATEADMYVGSTSNYVTYKDATSAGQLADGSYAMIMASNLSKANANAINQKYYVRAYVIIDGTYYYSEVETYSTYDVAKALYDGNLMQTEAGHAYVYALITKVTPDYAAVAYDLKNTIVVAD